MDKPENIRNPALATDRELLTAYSGRADEAAFAELARRYHGMIFATAQRACKNSHDAQDVLQSTLSTLARRARELGNIQCLGAWLHRAATLESMKTVRQNTRRKRRERIAAEDLLTPAERLAEHDPEALAARIENRDIPFTDNWARKCFNGRAIRAIATKDPAAALHHLDQASSGTYDESHITDTYLSITYIRPDFAAENINRIVDSQIKHLGTEDRQKLLARRADDIIAGWRHLHGSEKLDDTINQFIQSHPQLDPTVRETFLNARSITNAEN